MKTIYLVMASLCLISSAHATKLEQGLLELKGAVSLTNESPEGARYDRRTAFDFQASGQYYLRPQLSAGLEGGVYAHSYRSTVFSLGPIASYHYLANDTVAPYFTLTPIGISKKEVLAADYFTRGELGAALFLGDNAALSTGLRFTHLWLGGGWDSKYADTFALNMALSVFL